MQYNQVLEKINPKFLKKCFLLSGLPKEKTNKNSFDANCDNIIFRIKDPNRYDYYENLVFSGLLFQAWQGFNNENKHEDFIDLDSYNASIRKNRKYTHFWFSEFEPDKPLSPELQALICALSYAMDLVSKTGYCPSCRNYFKCDLEYKEESGCCDDYVMESEGKI